MSQNEETQIIEVEQQETALSCELQEVAGEAERFAKLGISENTKRAYRADWQAFELWCERHNLTSMPCAPQTVGLFLTQESRRLKPSTLQRRLVSINKAHRIAGYPQPGKDESVMLIWRGIRREKGTRKDRVRPMLVENIIEVANALSNRLIDVRDRAIMLVGFSAALRRSELIALQVRDVEFVSEGIILHIQRSKTDQEGQGRSVGIPYGLNPKTCPVLAVENWIARAFLSDGPLFRSINRFRDVSDDGLSSRTIANIVKRLVAMIDLDPSRYSGHSLRAGLATSAAQAGVPERLIMAQTGHASVAVVRQYIRDGSLFRENPVSKMGL